MVHLFDLPPITASERIIKRQAAYPDLSQLIPQQLSVFTGITERLLGNSGGVIVLQGQPGCGKTYTVSRIIEYYLYRLPYQKVAFAGTTNKAVKVAYRSTTFKSDFLTFNTIHSLLALREVILPDGSLDFFPDTRRTPPITEYKVVFIDEASMFNKKLWQYLAVHVENGLKVVFVGDANQTPPVKESFSISFNRQWQSDNNVSVFKLHEIMRQAADNPIINLISTIGGNLDRQYNIAMYPEKYGKSVGDKGIFCLNKRSIDDRLFVDKLLEHMFVSDNFKQDTNFAKVICWRNDAVNAMNRGIRRKIYKHNKLRRIEPAEKLITKSPVFDEDLDTILINNAEELEVIEFERKFENINNGMYELTYYDTKVRYYDIVGNEMLKYVNIPTDLGMITYTKILDELAKKAKSFKPGTFQANNCWKEFWNFKKSFADVGYNYAITTHLAQGSTYQNALVLERDIIANPKVNERNRILYTAISRPSDRLFII